MDDVTLENNIYYVPFSTNNPLFDSFTIHFDTKEKIAIVSVFQITISLLHGGSSQGYPLICKIMKRANDLLNSGIEKKDRVKCDIEVRYFLVCPEGQGENQWQMPAKWNLGTRNYNHCRDAYCIRIPVVGTWHLFAPNFLT